MCPIITSNCRKKAKFNHFNVPSWQHYRINFFQMKFTNECVLFNFKVYLQCSCEKVFCLCFSYHSLKKVLKNQINFLFILSYHKGVHYIQPWPFTIKWLLNKPYVNEVTLREQKLSKKSCQPFNPAQKTGRML